MAKENKTYKCNLFYNDVICILIHNSVIISFSIVFHKKSHYRMPSKMVGK